MTAKVLTYAVRGGALTRRSGSGDPSDPNLPFSDTNPPWALKAGESPFDNLPAGVTVFEHSDYSGSGTRSLGATLAAARAAATSPFVLHLPGGHQYDFTDFSFASGSGAGRCYQDVNSPKYFSGLVGDDAGPGGTVVQVPASALTSTQLSAVAAGNQDIDVIYAGGTALTTPTFFSGINFRGAFQQTTTLSGLSGTAPATYAGIHLASVKDGSMIQFCRFQGFGFAAKSSPPYELGAVDSITSKYTVRRTEIDGRLAAAVNPSQPRSSGGLMWNFEAGGNGVKVLDSWLHHTRRSGFAMHDHDPTAGGNASDQGIYYIENFQVENIADVADGFAGSGLGFTPTNVEELRRTFTWVRPRFTASAAKGPQHINIATSNGNTLAVAMTVIDPKIGNTAFNGMLVVNVVVTPNGLGTDPYYTAYQASGFSAIPITVTNNGVTLTPILYTSYNSAVHTPASNFLIRFN